MQNLDERDVDPPQLRRAALRSIAARAVLMPTPRVPTPRVHAESMANATAVHRQHTKRFQEEQSARMAPEPVQNQEPHHKRTGRRKQIQSLLDQETQSWGGGGRRVIRAFKLVEHVIHFQVRHRVSFSAATAAAASATAAAAVAGRQTRWLVCLGCQ